MNASGVILSYFEEVKNMIPDGSSEIVPLRSRTVDVMRGAYDRMVPLHASPEIKDFRTGGYHTPPTASLTLKTQSASNTGN